jgi:hypothetical protein
VKRSSTGYRFIHTALDDGSRLAYSEIHHDEQATTAAGFWRRAGGHRRIPRRSGMARLPGCCATKTSHRGAINLVDGRFQLA